MSRLLLIVMFFLSVELCRAQGPQEGQQVEPAPVPEIQSSSPAPVAFEFPAPRPWNWYVKGGPVIPLGGGLLNSGLKTGWDIESGLHGNICDFESHSSPSNLFLEIGGSY